MGLQVLVELADALRVAKVIALLKVLTRLETVWLEEVEQCPQLLDRVLKWGTSDQELVSEGPCLQLTVQCRLVVLQPARVLYLRQSPPQ